MRRPSHMFSYLSPEQRVPHRPSRSAAVVRQVALTVTKPADNVAPAFSEHLIRHVGRTSIDIRSLCCALAYNCRTVLYTARTPRLPDSWSVVQTWPD